MNAYPVLILLFFCISCSTTSYYQSPLHANANGYKAIPLHRDGISSAIYGSAAASTGGANDNWRDGLQSFTGELHRSHNHGRLQAYYGLTGTIGSYRVDSVHNGNGIYLNHTLDTSLINKNTGRKRFSSIGGFAALNYVVPTQFGEWRIPCVEVAWQREYGNYLRFRRMLPDTAANMIEKRNYSFTIAVSTDLVFAVKNGSFGFKLSFVGNPGGVDGYDVDRNPYRYSSSYFSQTLHANFKRFYAFTQFNAGNHAIIFMGGGGYRGGK